MNSTFLGDPRYAAQDWYAQRGMENFGPQTSVYFDDGTMSAYSWSGNLDSATMLNSGIRSGNTWLKNPIDVRIGTALSSIDFPTFEGCSSLTAAYIPGNVKTLYAQAFYQCENLKYIALGEGLGQLAAGALRSCSSLSHIKLPESLSAVDSSVLRDNFSLRYANIPSSLSVMNTYMFGNCSSLYDVQIPDGMLSIRNTVFRQNFSLSSISLPATLAYIGTNSFVSYFNLSVIDFTRCEQVPYLAGSGAFGYTPNDKKIIVPDGLYEQWIAANNWSNLASCIVKASEA